MNAGYCPAKAMHSAPTVSVLMITYNHERFIREALESVLAQRTRFNFEVVIGEDFSTDGTRGIVMEYAERYPAVVRTLLAPANLGPHRNFIRTLRACRARYVALLEGDDYWTNAEKLSRQVDILDAHPEYSICAHRARVVYEGGGRESWEYPVWDNVEYRIDDLLRENFIPTCSAMFRNGLLLEIPEWYRRTPFGDWALHLLVAQYGDINVVPEAMSVYRAHEGGLWSKMDPPAVLANTVQLLRFFEETAAPALKGRISAAREQFERRSADAVHTAPPRHSHPASEPQR